MCCVSYTDINFYAWNKVSWFSTGRICLLMKPTSDYFGKTIERDFLNLSFSFFDFSKESLEKLCLTIEGLLKYLR